MLNLCSSWNFGLCHKVPRPQTRKRVAKWPKFLVNLYIDNHFWPISIPPPLLFKKTRERADFSYLFDYGIVFWFILSWSPSLPKRCVIFLSGTLTTSVEVRIKKKMSVQTKGCSKKNHKVKTLNELFCWQNQKWSGHSETQNKHIKNQIFGMGMLNNI